MDYGAIYTIAQYPLIPATGLVYYYFSLSIISNHEILLSIASLHDFQLHRLKYNDGLHMIHGYTSSVTDE